MHLAQRVALAERHAECGGDVPSDGPERAEELASKAAEAAFRAVEDNGWRAPCNLLRAATGAAAGR
jgi:hypothetical protein